jgi:hypothetical protein
MVSPAKLPGVPAFIVPDVAVFTGSAATIGSIYLLFKVAEAGAFALHRQLGRLCWAPISMIPERSMSRRLPLITLLLFLPLWLAASYGVRYVLMEDAQWVGVCAEQAQVWQCQARSVMGLMIHFRVIAWTALGLALLAQLLPARAGWRLAVLALVFAIPALVLYSASIAVFAVVLAGLRLVRRSS